MLTYILRRLGWSVLLLVIVLLLIGSKQMSRFPMQWLIA